MAGPSDLLLHRLILEALPLGICDVNCEAKIILWSEGAEKLTGYFRQDVIGQRTSYGKSSSNGEGLPASNAFCGRWEKVRLAMCAIHLVPRVNPVTDVAPITRQAHGRN